MGEVPGDLHPSEMERLDKPCTRARIELATIRSSVENSDHSANSYTLDYIKTTLYLSLGPSSVLKASS